MASGTDEKVAIIMSWELLEFGFDVCQQARTSVFQ